MINFYKDGSYYRPSKSYSKYQSLTLTKNKEHKSKLNLNI